MSPLSDDLDPFSLHLFNAKWQYCQYKSVSSKIPIKTVIFCEEFAENYTCRPQDAPQACHWNNSQCTIHPIVATYNCPVENCSVIFISDDLTHDHHFVCSSMQLLKEEGLEFDRLIHFSDGAPTQYKNRIAFVDCSYATEDLGVKSERHFFGSRHGKGPCDHEIGVIKKSVRIAVAARQDEVASPRDLSDICKKKRLCLPSIEGHHHTKRRFVFVDKTSIVRERPEQTATKSLKNTRKLHCISGIQPYVLSVRERSCFCSGCRGGNLCLHAELAGPWNVCNMSLNARCQPPVVDQTPTPLPVDDTTLSSVHDQSTSHLTIENQAHPVDQDHTSQSENMHRKPVKVGDFVRVTVLPASGKVGHGKLFVAFVKNVMHREGKAHVSFLRRTQGGHYVYPVIEDESIVMFYEINNVLPEPHFNRRGHFYFDI